MNLYFIETDNEEDYEEHFFVSFVVLSPSEPEAVALIRASGQYGCDWIVTNSHKFVENVSYPGMPTTATILH